ncbi:MAG: urease accessory UreF family protein [Pseudomonadota bacterium]
MKAMQILTAWLSPAYPIGAYSYSHGLEWAIEAGWVGDGPQLKTWTSQILEFGAGRSDAILLTHAHAAEDPSELAELAEALAPSRERHLETMAQGTAFARTTAAVWGIDLPPMAYPVALGHAARKLSLPRAPLVTLFLQAFAANIISAGVRLVPLGQTEGQRITADLLPLSARIAEEVQSQSLDEIGGIAVHADIASMLHETQYSRLYRS